MNVPSKGSPAFNAVVAEPVGEESYVFTHELNRRERMTAATIVLMNLFGKKF
jgi:hypothetical protein